MFRIATRRRANLAEHYSGVAIHEEMRVLEMRGRKSNYNLRNNSVVDPQDCSGSSLRPNVLKTKV